eukprot:SAG22_NODE_6211_length_885_cov_1.511450_1_plen_59_part_10
MKTMTNTHLPVDGGQDHAGHQLQPPGRGRADVPDQHHVPELGPVRSDRPGAAEYHLLVR